MFNVRLAGGRLCGRRLFTWLSLVVSLVASFVLSFFPLGVLGEIWDFIESVSEGFLTYSCMMGPIFGSQKILFYNLKCNKEHKIDLSLGQQVNLSFHVEHTRAKPILTK